MAAEAKIPVPDEFKSLDLREGERVTGYLRGGELVLTVEVKDKRTAKSDAGSFREWINRDDIPEYTPNPEVLADPRAAAILSR